MYDSTTHQTAQIHPECLNLAAETARQTEDLLVRTNALAHWIEKQVERIMHEPDRPSSVSSV